jgi:hypothetical protein
MIGVSILFGFSPPPKTVPTMFATGGSSSDFHEDVPVGVDLGIGQQVFLMPDVSTGNRERGMGMAINRGHTHARTFSHSPQPAYTPHPGDEFQAEDGHSAVICSPLIIATIYPCIAGRSWGHWSQLSELSRWIP